MGYDQEKISLRQALLLFVTMMGSLSVRAIPVNTAQSAKQAAWLCPLITLGILILYMSALERIFKRNQAASLMDIIENSLGKILGKAICIIYFIWIGFLNLFYLRIYAERIIISSFPMINKVLFLGVMAGIVAYVLRLGIVNFARMAEIFFWLIVPIYLLFNFLIIPELAVKNWYPITLDDFLPVLKGSMITNATWCYLTIIFLFGDKIIKKDRMKKLGWQSLLILTFLTLQVILVPLGVFGWPIVSEMPLPYFAAIREISLFNIIERLEAGIFSIWILTDFLLIGTLSFAALHLFGRVFKVADQKPFVSIYMVFLFFGSLLVASNVFELNELSRLVLTPTNTILFLALPLFVLILNIIGDHLRIKSSH